MHPSNFAQNSASLATSPKRSNRHPVSRRGSTFLETNAKVIPQQAIEPDYSRRDASGSSTNIGHGETKRQFAVFGMETMMEHGAQVLLAISISTTLCLAAWVWARRRLAHTNQ
jgi:hypothetical protein